MTQILRRIEDLPTLPTVLQQIMDITSQEDSSASDLIEIVNADQSLTANLLRVANSPVYGVPYRIESARQAIVLLGFNEVRSIALSATVFSTLADSGPKSVFKREGFWRHSYLVAHLTREFFDLFPDPDHKALYFTAGLLHDIGIVVLDQFFPTEFTEILAMIRQEKDDPLTIEKRYLNVTHAQVGAALLKRWQLPADLVAAVEGHHSLEKIKDPAPLHKALYYGNLLAKILGYLAYSTGTPLELATFYQSEEAAKLRETGALLDEDILTKKVDKYKNDQEMIDLILGAAAMPG